MTPDDLRALREVRPCPTCQSCREATNSAVWEAGECDDCLTLLLNAALAQRVEGWASNPSNVFALAGSLGIATQHMNLTSVVQGADIGRRALLAAMTGGAK